MCFLNAINSDRQTRLLDVLGQIAMILGDKKNLSGGKTYQPALICISYHTGANLVLVSNEK